MKSSIKEPYEAIVGIFMPAYNHGEYIDEAIKSLKKQTFQDFVVHIVDDGSNDGRTPEILKSISYEKAKLFLNFDNKGVALRARQHFKKLNTKYVLVLCADDVLAPEFLEKTVEFLEKYEDYGAVSVNIKFFKKNIEDCYAEQTYDAKTMELPLVLARNRVLGSSLMRKKALDETDLTGGFVRYQDWDRWISMLEAGWKIGLVPEYLFYYRHLQGSLSHSATMQDELEIRKKLLKKHKNSYQKYYAEVIDEMEKSFLEMKQRKDWLDGEYINMRKRIKEMKNERIGILEENERLKMKLEKYDNLKIVKIARLIKRKMNM